MAQRGKKLATKQTTKYCHSTKMKLATVNIAYSRLRQQCIR